MNSNQSFLDICNGKIIVVAVSKKKSIEQIKEVYSLGFRDFGESYVQEAIPKIEELKTDKNYAFSDIKWHFIGALQSNKIKKIVNYFDVIQSLTSKKHVDEIDKRAKEFDKLMGVMVEIYLGKEDTKRGIDLKTAEDLIESILKKPNLNLVGIMIMAPKIDVEDRRKYFKEAKIFFDEIKSKYSDLASNFNYLSMGMSSDYKIAIQEGSNMIRIGTAIFGKRE